MNFFWLFISVLAFPLESSTNADSTESSASLQLFGSTDLNRRCTAEGSAALDAITADILQIAADINKICDGIESKMLGEQALGDDFVTQCEFIVKCIINAGSKCFQVDLSCLASDGLSKFISVFSQLLLCVLQFLGGLFRFVLVMGTKLLIPSGQWGASLSIPKIIMELVGKLFSGFPSLQSSLGGLMGQTSGMLGSTTQQCQSVGCTPDVNATSPLLGAFA